MDFDLETSIEESSSLMEVVNEQNKIIKALFTADELEKQYRAQGYSEAQIQQFHEGWMDKVKGAASSVGKGLNKLNPLKNKGTTVGDKVKNTAGGAWEWIKKMVAKFINWCKKIWLKISNLWNNDASLLEKYSDELKNATFEWTVPIATGTDASRVRFANKKDEEDYDEKRSSQFDNDMSRMGKAVGDALHLKIFGNIGDYFKRSRAAVKGVTYLPPDKFVPNHEKTFRNAAAVLRETKIDTGTAQKKGKYTEFKAFVDNIKSNTVINDTITKAKASAAERSVERPGEVSGYIAYLNAVSTLNLKLAKAAHSEARRAIIKALAVVRKLDKNEAAQILEQQLVDVQYMYESLIMEADEVDKVINDSIDVKSSDVNLSDVNLADSDFGSLSDDPNKLVYDKDCYSQDVEMGDENIAGTVDIDPFDTTDKPVSGSQTKAMESALNELLDFDLTY